MTDLADAGAGSRRAGEATVPHSLEAVEPDRPDAAPRGLDLVENEGEVVGAVRVVTPRARERLVAGWGMRRAVAVAVGAVGHAAVTGLCPRRDFLVALATQEFRAVQARLRESCPLLRMASDTVLFGYHHAEADRVLVAQGARVREMRLARPIAAVESGLPMAGLADAASRRGRVGEPPGGRADRIRCYYDRAALVDQLLARRPVADGA